MAGLRPVVDLGNLGFSLTAMDQITNEGPKARFASGGQLSAPAGLHERAPSPEAHRAASLHAPVVSVAALDVPVAYSLELADEVVPGVDRVVAAIDRVCRAD